MFNTAPIGIAVLSSDNGWQIINPALGILLGYTEKQLGRIDFRMLSGEKDGGPGRRRFRIQTTEQTYKHKKGYAIGVIQNLVPIRSEDKDDTYLIYMIQEAFGDTGFGESLSKINEKLSKKARYNAIARNVLQAVHSTIDLQEVVEKAVTAMSENINVADNVTIYMVDGEYAVIRAYKGFDEEFINRMRKIPRPNGFTWKAIMEGRVQYCADMAKDKTIGPAGREYGIRSYVSMPVRVNGAAVGCININSTKKTRSTVTSSSFSKISPNT